MSRYPKMEAKKGSVLIIIIIIVVCIVGGYYMSKYFKLPRALDYSATPQSRDKQRIIDMDLLKKEQMDYRARNETYYLHEDYPIPIGKDLAQIPLDPLNTGKFCGTDYVYCNISNTSLGDEQKFCYYAKLEDGGFYAVSQDGSITKSKAPDSLAGCIVPDVN
jgi:hypothetical protein